MARFGIPNGKAPAKPQRSGSDIEKTFKSVTGAFKGIKDGWTGSDTPATSNKAPALAPAPAPSVIPALGLGGLGYTLVTTGTQLLSSPIAGVIAQSVLSPERAALKAEIALAQQKQAFEIANIKEQQRQTAYNDIRKGHKWSNPMAGVQEMKRSEKKPQGTKSRRKSKSEIVFDILNSTCNGVHDLKDKKCTHKALGPNGIGFDIIEQNGRYTNSATGEEMECDKNAQGRVTRCFAKGHKSTKTG